LLIASPALQIAAVLGRPDLSGRLWLARKMLFGFALALILEFLFMAERNCSGQPTSTGPLPKVLASAVPWSAACFLFTLQCPPVLTRQRLDGKPG
jgi:uncharacterized protein involved in response to NO